MGEAQFDQARVLDFLASPEAYTPPPERVERIDTHASVVFLAGSRSYKVKRAVKYPFLDFSTLTLRRRACLNELSINRRTAPHLYLEVVPVAVRDDGKFCLGGEGDIVEWVLVMRRFEQANLYDRMAEDGRLPLSAMPQLAEAVAALHRSADRFLAPEPSISALRTVLKDNKTALAAQVPTLLPKNFGSDGTSSREAFETLEPLLKARALGGFVRHCHGDLHLRNIVEIDGLPVLFDAIEFDTAIATVDVLYDLAFLLMDLGARGLAAHANAVLNAYLEACGNTGNLIGLKALPLFLSMRATVRTKVELLRAELSAAPRKPEVRNRAESYMRLARDYLETRKPRLIAIGGLSGSGKSSVARELAPHLLPFPGAVHVRSDRERKRLFGLGVEQGLPERAYAAEVSDIVYGMCCKRALMGLAGGQVVIVDAVHAKEKERKAIAECAAHAGVTFTGIWLKAPPEAMRSRIAGRVADVSDATPDVLDQQLKFDLGAQSFTVVDASLPLDEVIASCLDVIGQEQAD